MDDRKTIWCISKYASPPKYGVGARLFYIAREFSKMDNNVLLISSDSNHLANYPISNKTYNFESYDNLEHMWIKTYKYEKSASIKRFISWFDFEFKLFKFNRKKHGKPDIIIVSSLSLLSIIYGIFLKDKYKCKLIFEIRDIHPLTLTEEFGVNKLNPMVLFLAIIEKLGYNKADLIVGTMPNLKKHVTEIIGKDKEVFHSPLGIHEVWYKEKETSPTIDYLFPRDNKFVVGYAGSMGKSNAMSPFIEAIKRMSENKEIYFVIVGDGDLKESYIRELSGLNNVKFGPKIMQSQIPYFLSKCDLLYLSTHDSKIWDYGQSLNKMIDYMMAGKPIIASYSGYESMLNEADCGMFLPTGDVNAIIDSIKMYKNMNPTVRNILGSNGKKWIEENNSYNNIAIKYYNKIIETLQL